MSLDVCLSLKRHISYDDRMTWVEDYEVVYTDNITHNLNKMAEKALIYKALWRPEEISITKASELIDILQEGYYFLTLCPDRFKKLNPENGWGNYEGLVKFVSRYLEACRNYPEAIIIVSR